MSGDFRSTGLYCLTTRKTTTGKTFIVRAEWEDWFGAPVAVNERRVSGWFPSREHAIPFCIRYASRHAGCATHREAAEFVTRLGTDVPPTSATAPVGASEKDVP